MTANVLITGATSGIGRDAAFYLARRGLRVFASGRNPAKLEPLAAEAKAQNLPLETAVLEVTSAASIAACAADLEARTGGHGIDILINNAGYGQLGPATEVSAEALRAQFETNVFGLMDVTRAFVPPMRRRRQGRIINISSLAGRVVFPMFGVYHASKHAVEALSDALRQELKPFGIGVAVVQPGLIDTGFEDIAAGSLDEFCAPGAPYASYLQASAQTRARLRPLYVPAAHCSRAIYRAATASRPRARYVVTGHARLMLLLHALLPSRAWDFMVSFPLGLTRPPDS